MAGSETQRQERMIQGLVGLRQVAKLLPGNPDVQRATLGLEEALGTAVSQRIAARALGIPHPQVSKLISHGKLSTIDTTRGKAQVEVRALVDFIVAGEDAASGEQSEAEKRDLTNVLTLRALSFHRALSRSLDRDMVERAQSILEDKRSSGEFPADIANRWEKILERPVSEIAIAMVEQNENGDELRSHSPFNSMGRRAEDRR